MDEPHYSRSKDSRTGTIYVYQIIRNYWDKEKKQARNKRVLVGKVDPSTGEVIPTGPRGRPRKKTLMNNPSEANTDYENLYKKACSDISTLNAQRNEAHKTLDLLIRCHEETLAQISELEAKAKEESEIIKRLQRNL